MKIIEFSGVKVDNVTLGEAVARAGEMLANPQPHIIVTPNPEIIVACQDNHELMGIMNSADLRVPDGISMVVVSTLLGKPLKARVSGIDLMLKLIEVYGKAGKKIFLLGSGPGIAEQAAAKLKQDYPGINIVGTHHGYIGDDSAVIQKIKQTSPDLLFVGMGAGKQEQWINRHLDELSVPVSMVIGGSLDVISGSKNRAPKWIQALYLEWLYRLITEPSRWKRQLALPKFLWLAFSTKSISTTQ
jgi:N-acetylglucosaminyldiphosphoundecaprenol N-acetyl-beta-D-mannosaminyltransferase